MHTLKESIQQQTLVDLFSDLREFQLDDMFDTIVLGRAYEYVNSIQISSSTDTSIEAEVVSSSRYILQLNLDEGRLQGTCSCPYNDSCKHLAALMIVGLRQ